MKPVLSLSTPVSSVQATANAWESSGSGVDRMISIKSEYG